MRRLFFAILVLLFALSGSARADLSFPLLTGRVVDDAHILTAQDSQYLNQLLEDYDNQTSNQIVVVTLPSLQGTSIEDYCSQLGRAWGIGQKNKDNGVLLIVAPTERKVRIEVGYGLERNLTDATANQIIQRVILPQIRAGDMREGIKSGVRVIINMLGSQDQLAAQRRATNEKNISGLIFFLVLVLFLIGKIALYSNPTFRRAYPMVAAFLLMSNNITGARSGSGGYSGGFGGNSLSGGGGSYGGGGAAGEW